MSEPNHQPGILAAHCAVGRTLSFRISPGTDVPAALRRLRDGFSPEAGVVGLGEPALRALARPIPGLRTFPAMSGAACSVPSTQQALWVLLRGTDRGQVFDHMRDLRALIGEAFQLVDVMDTFMYRGGRDLTRFEDGTENPKDDDAVAAAIVRGSAGPGLAGSSFVAVQRWVHDLVRFGTFSHRQRNDVIGRDADTNEELEDAPDTAHVKRTAQESFEPAAFMVRRSMPWATTDREGLEFIAYVANLDAFERMMRRMVGEEDGKVDGLFSFSFPVTGGYYWCPPLAKGRLDLRALGL